MTTFNKKELSTVLRLISPTLATQNYIPILSHIKFKNGLAEAYNDALGISINLPQEKNNKDIDLNICLPGDLLTKILNSFTTDEVEIEVNKSGSATISAGSSARLKINTLNTEDFPLVWPKGPSHATILINSDFLTGLEMCLVSVAKDLLRPYQMGVTMVRGANKNAILYSTDNRTASRYFTNSKINLTNSSEAVIFPTAFCEQILSLSTYFHDAEVSIDVYDDCLLAHIGDSAEIITKMLDNSKALNFDGVFAKYAADEEIIKSSIKYPHGFEAAVSRSLLVLSSGTKEGRKFVELGVGQGHLSFSCKSDQAAQDEELPLLDSANDLQVKTFKMDPMLIKRALGGCECLTFQPGALVLNNAGASFTHIIAPFSA